MFYHCPVQTLWLEKVLSYSSKCSQPIKLEDIFDYQYLQYEQCNIQRIGNKNWVIFGMLIGIHVEKELELFGSVELGMP